MNRYILFLFFAIFQLHSFDEQSVRLINSPVEGGQIELLLMKPGAKNPPLLLFLHGCRDEGLKSIKTEYMSHWVDKGYTVAAVSMPGFGETSGVRDFCGPKTLATLNYAIDEIKKEVGVKSLGIIGCGHGGIAAILLSTQRDDLKCIVASNITYDLPRHYGSGDLLDQRVHEAYDFDHSDENELQKRSLLYLADQIKAPLYLFYCKDSVVIKEDEVRDFVSALEWLEKECHLAIKEGDPSSGRVTYPVILNEAEEWVESHLW